MRAVPLASCSRPDAGAFTSRRSAACRDASGNPANRLKRGVSSVAPSFRRSSHMTKAAGGVLSGGGGNNGNNITRPTSFGGADGPDHGPPGTLLLSMLCTLCSLLVAAPAHARVDPLKAKQAPAASSPVDAYVEQLWAVIGPTVSRLGFSGLLGMAAASALKWIGRTLIVLMGLAFLLVQSMSSSGMIEVRWAEVNKRVLSWLHLNPSGVNGEDVKRLVKSGMAMISEGVPDVAGFLVGFTLGLRVM